MDDYQLVLGPSELEYLRRLDELEWQEILEESRLPIVDEDGYHPERDDS